MSEMNSKIMKILPRVEKPSRYLGSEFGARVKAWDRAALRVAFAFPDLYEIGMSHLGHQILYHIINDQPDMLAERVYAPWKDMVAELRKNDLSLFSLESHRPIGEFDILGFSLSYELSFTNILLILDLAQIPYHSKDRDENHPLIIAGGPCAFNPEPVADFFDVVVLGDGEKIILDIANLTRQLKNDRKKLLRELSKLEGVYIPSFFDVSYGENGCIEKINPKYSDYTKIKKSLVPDLNDAYLPIKPIVPHMQVTQDRVGVEVQRGCVRGCRFCQAGYIYRPLRQRRSALAYDAAVSSLDSSGHEDLAFLSLSIGDYPPLCDVLLQTFNKFNDTHVNISMPSMRVETLTDQVLDHLKKSRKSSFTLAPEAGTEKLRRVINKGNSDEDLYKTAEDIFNKGWTKIKLYFMIGLPHETDEDIQGIIDTAFRIRDLGRRLGVRPSITVSTSTLVPKPFTPFQWVRQISLEEIQRKQRYIKDKLRGPGLQYRWHRPEMSTIECVLSRGDRRLSRVVEEVYRTNGGFDGWDEHFSYDRWANAINQEGLGVDHYQRSLERDDVLPWNHLNVTLNKDFLWKEYERSNEYEVVNNCLDGTCLKCGVCDFDEIKNRVEPSNPDLLEPAKTLTIHNEIFKYYFSFSKTGPTRFISHLETMTAIIRSLRRTHLPLVYSQGFHPHPKISMCAALPVGMESEMEYFQIDLSEKIDVDATLERINHNLPSGFKINEISERSIPEGRVSYLIFADLNVDDFNRKGEEIIQVQRKKGPKTVNLKEIVEGLAQIEPGVIRLTYREGMEGGAKPFEVVAALMGAPLADAKEVRIRKMVNR